MGKASADHVLPRVPSYPPVHGTWRVPGGRPSFERGLLLPADSFSLRFNHRSFQKPDPFSEGSLERRIRGKNGEGTVRLLVSAVFVDRRAICFVPRVGFKRNLSLQDVCFTFPRGLKQMHVFGRGWL